MTALQRLVAEWRHLDWEFQTIRNVGVGRGGFPSFSEWAEACQDAHDKFYSAGMSIIRDHGEAIEAALARAEAGEVEVAEVQKAVGEIDEMIRLRNSRWPSINQMNSWRSLIMKLSCALIPDHPPRARDL